MSEKNPILDIIDTFAQCAQVIIAIAFIIVTIKFSSIASRQTQEYNQMTQRQRKSQIQPFLEIESETNFDPTFDNIIVRIRNYGFGPARKLLVMIESEGKIRSVDHVFSPVGNLGVTNPPGRQQILYTLQSPAGRDFVMPNEEVEFKQASDNFLPQELKEQFEKMTPWQRMDLFTKRPKIFTFYLSYFDMDDNEYLYVTKLPPAGARTAMLIVPVYKKNKTDDSLKALSRNLKNFESRTYDNVNLRSPEGLFKNLDSLTNK